MKWLAITLATLALAASASAQDVEHYTVQPGDTCGTIAERYYGSPRRYDRIHEHNPDLGPMPHHLHPGQVLELPLPRTTGADATVTDARGTVRAQPATQPAWSGARIGQELGSGARISTGERSSAELTFRSSSVAAIREETLVIVHGATVEHVRDEGTRAELREGSLLSRLSSLSGAAPLLVTTPSAEVDVHEGETSVRVTGGDTSVSTHSGRPSNVRASDGSGAVEVPAGHGTHVRRGSPPTPPVPLPIAPSWAVGDGRSFLATFDSGGTMRGEWLAAPGAASYLVEIARRDDGRDLVYQVEVPATVTHFEAYHFPAGSYFVRVSTIDADHLEGRPTSGERFEMVGVRFVAPGETLPPASPDDTVDVLEELDALSDAALFATSAPPPPEVLRGTHVVVGEGIICARGTSEPSHELVLDEMGVGFLTCIDAAGQTIAGLDVSVIGIRATLVAADGSPLGVLRRGTTVPVRIRFDASADERAILVTGAPGVDVEEVALLGGSQLGANLVIAESAAESLTLSFAHRDEPTLSLGTAAFTTEPPLAPPPLAPPLPPFAVHEGLGAFAMPSWVGLRDEQRTGIGATLGIMVASARLGEQDPRVRMVAGVTAGLLNEYLRISAVAPLDILGQSSRSSDRGARDLFVSLGSRVLSSAETGGVGLAFDVGLWTPTAGASGLNRARLSVATDFSARVGERVVLRTRQAGIFDVGSGDSMLWASAYGVDVLIAEPLTIGVEGTMTLGHEDGREWYAGGAALALGLDLSPVFLSLAGRYGFGDDLFPTATIALNARAAFDP